MPDMPHSFRCEATDWLRGIFFGSPVKDYALGISVVILDGPPLFRYLKV